jgi:hypothetical protein
VEQTGTLNAALLTVGSDGATYQFPAGTGLVVRNGSFQQTIAVDGAETAINFLVPVGTVTVEMVFPNNMAQLRRTVGGVTTTVPATWLDPQPLNVTIALNATTELVLHFEAIGLADVTFDMGNLAVALDVQRNARTQPGKLAENGQYIHSAQFFGTSATMEAQTYFAMTNGESHQHSFTFRFTGPWAQVDAASICAPTQLESFTTLDGESGFSRLVSLVANGSRNGCVYDQGTNDLLVVDTFVTGAAPAALQTILPSASYLFAVQVRASVGDVYDGHTFLQSKLETTTVINNGSINGLIRDLVAMNDTMTSDGFLSGNVRIIP